MKSITRILLFYALVVGHTLQAQIWSDVGSQGFTPDPGGTFGAGSNSPFLAIQGNTPYLVYTRPSLEPVVMRYTGGAWTALPTVTSVGDTPHLTFDNSGVPHLVYQTSGASNVKKFNGTSWVQVGSAAINNTLGIGGGLVPKIAINPVNNEPYIVFADAGNGINVARFNGTAWVLVGQQDFQVGSVPNIAFSTTGIPYVVSRNVSTGTLSVSQFNGTSWVLVGPAGFAGIAPVLTSIVMDGAGVPYVLATTPSGGHKASVYKFDGTNWIAVGASAFTTGDLRFAQLKFNGAGVLHIVYNNFSASNKVSVMRFDGTSWVGVGAPEFSSGLAHTPSLAFDASNTVHVGFGDGSFGNAATVMKLCASSSATVTPATPATICESGTLTLSATANTTNVKWYSEAGKLVGTGLSFVTPTLTATTNYLVAAYDANGCSSARVSVAATVNQKPTITLVVPGSRCGSGTVLISATSSAGTVNWYATPTGGSALGTGNSFTTPSLSATTTYYAEGNINGCLSATRSPIQAVVKEVPFVGSGIGGFRCGPGSVTLTAASSPVGSSTTWFTAASGGTNVGTGTSFTTPTITTTTTYYAEATFNGCVSTTRLPVIAEVRPIPSVTASSGGAVCHEGAVNLSVTTSGTSQPQWYDVPTGGTVLANTANFTTPVLTATKTYYVEAYQNGCGSTPRTAVEATIKPLPTLSVSDVSRCDAGTVSFEAGSNGTVSWFAAPTGGSPLATGPTYTTPVISVTTPYFVQATLNGCTSLSRAQVQGVVITTPPKPTIAQNNSNIEAPVLTSSASANNQWYKDGSLIGGATAVTYTVSDLGEYTVQVNNTGCLSPFSDPVFYIITGAEGIQDRMLRIYPNPVAEELVIQLGGFAGNELVQVAVVDMLGRQLRVSTARGGEEMQLNVRGLQMGQYLLVARQGSRKIQRQFIKTN